MKIRLLTDLATVAGQYEAGHVLDLDEVKANEFITRGLAEAAGADVETAMRGDAPERATLPRGRGR